MTPLLTRIREKVIEANPSIGKHYCGSSYCGIDPRCLEEQPRDIRLADILLAMNAARKNKTGMSDPYCYVVSIDGTFLKEIGGAGSFTYEIIGPRWDLNKDSIEDQTVEVQEFIGKLLKV